MIVVVAMKCVYINLDRCSARREWMQQIGGMMGLSLERVSAVDGKTLSKAEIEAIGGPPPHDRLSASAIGCFLSHRKAWEIAVRSGADHTAIFEDDMHFSKATPAFLVDDSWVPRDADIVRLELYRSRCEVEAASIRTLGNRRLHLLRGTDVGTGAYIISQVCAQRLLDEVTTIYREFDQILFNTESPVFHKLKIYKLIPSLCVQDKFQDLANVPGQSFAAEIDRTGYLEPKLNALTFSAKLAREMRRVTRQIYSAPNLWIGTKATVTVRASYS